MKIFSDLAQFSIWRNNLDAEIKLLGRPHSVALVPTMGNLHVGHLSLINKGLKDNETTIVTIYVNPKQFGPKEDFEKYPRTLKGDIAKIKGLIKDKGYKDRELVIFAPSSDVDIYPPGFSTVISVKGLTEPLCGRIRPGHFDGVATVVYRLFHITRPHVAYFGQKDYQQFLVIKRMANDMGLPINIFPMPTKRDENGLALSSRNQFIKKSEMDQALILPKIITKLKKILEDTPWKKAWPKAQALVQETLKEGDWDYLEILDSVNLTTPNEETPILVIAGALRLSETRLIDNKLVEVQYVR